MCVRLFIYVSTGGLCVNLLNLLKSASAVQVVALIYFLSRFFRV